jgi:hypothetical protein
MSYLDWTTTLGTIPNKEEKTILELGCGLGTKELIQKFGKVISFETSVDDKWMNITIEDNKDATNWKYSFKPLSYYGFDTSEKNLLDSNGSIRSKTELNNYLTELDLFISDTIIDVAFVDQGFHQRGETVNWFMERGIPIIFAHDTNVGIPLYGWDLIQNEKWGYNRAGNFTPQGTTYYYNTTDIIL